MKDRSLIAVVISRWVSPFIFLYGIYLVAYGHLSPGGGFPGGVVLACAFILALLARGREAALGRMPYGVAKKLDATGAFIFLFTALAGLMFAGVFFLNFIQQFFPGQDLRLLSAGTVMVNNFAIGLKICASIFLVMLFVSVLRVGEGEKIKTMEEN